MNLIPEDERWVPYPHRVSCSDAPLTREERRIRGGLWLGLIAVLVFHAIVAHGLVMEILAPTTDDWEGTLYIPMELALGVSLMAVFLYLYLPGAFIKRLRRQDFRRSSGGRNRLKLTQIVAWIAFGSVLFLSFAVPDEEPYRSHPNVAENHLLYFFSAFLTGPDQSQTDVILNVVYLLGVVALFAAAVLIRPWPREDRQWTRTPETARPG